MSAAPGLTVRNPPPPPPTTAPAATAVSAATAATASPKGSWSLFTPKNAPKANEPNWKKFTKRNTGSFGVNNTTKKKNNSKNSLSKKTTNAAKEGHRQGVLANVKKGIKKKDPNGFEYTKPNTEANYETGTKGLKRTDNAMRMTSAMNRVDRLLVLFKDALTGHDTIDLDQYDYVFSFFPGDLDQKRMFIKVMETREVFPKQIQFQDRETKLADEAFIKEHKLEHVGMKKNKITNAEKGQGKNGINVQTYSDYTEEELTTIITKYKQTIFDDVLGLFIILTMYILTIFTTGDTSAFNNEKLVENIHMLISDDPKKEKIIINSFKEINTGVVYDKEKAASNSLTRHKIFAGGTIGIIGSLITGAAITMAAFTGVLIFPLGVAIAAGIGVVGTGAAIKGVVQQVGSTASKMYRDRYKIPKDKMAAGDILIKLYELLTHLPETEQYVGSNSGIKFTKKDYTFLKEFKTMFNGWFTDTELYNFIFLFTRERLKEFLGERYNEKRNLPEGWHEFKTDDGKVYYNSNEYSKKEPKTLDRYKLVSWVMPMVPFVSRLNYNDNITIHAPTEFSHGPKPPVAGQMGKQQVTTNFTTPKE